MTGAHSIKRLPWNQSDVDLIRTGRSDVSRCSRPEEARVFLANKYISERYRAALQQVSSDNLNGIKRGIKQKLRASQVFGPRCFAWSTAKTNLQCKHFLKGKARRANHCEIITFDTRRYEVTQTTAPFWKEIHSLAKQLRDNNATLILQGSQADHTTTPFSDIDLLLFGERENAEHLRLVSAVNRIILKADPLQHHGVFFYDADSLQYYSEAVLPIATYKKSTAIAEPVELKLRILNDCYSPAATLWSLVLALKHFLKGPSQIRGMWDWKFKISQFLLLPTLLAAVRGKYLYKGDSFSFAKPMFGKSAWQMIEELTRIRLQWHFDTEPIPSLTNSCTHISERIVGRLSQDITPIPESIASWKNEAFQKQAGEFLEETLVLAGLS